MLELAGPGVRGMGIDERSTLTNMAVEAGSFTGIIEADEVVVDYLAVQRGLPAEAVRRMRVAADPGATYTATFELDLGAVVPMVATPGDPRNGIPLADLRRTAGGQDVKINIAYGGSCTGGKRADMDMYASVLKRAVLGGQRVADGVRLVPPVRLPGRAPLRAREGVPRDLRQGGRRARRPIVRGVHQGGPRRERLAGPGDGQLAEPKLPRPQRSWEGVSG